MILKYELKKILTKHVNVVAFAIAMLVVIVFSAFAIGSVRFVDQQDVSHTGVSACRSLTAEKNCWAGELTPKVIGKAIEQRRGGEWQATDDIICMASYLVKAPDDESYDPELAMSSNSKEISNIYSIYKKNLRASAKKYAGSKKQESYINSRYEKIKMPFSYEAADSWDTMLLYATTVSMVLILLIGFLSAGIFAEDFKLKSDAVYFSSRDGRTKAARSKIKAGLLVATLVYWSGIALLSAICFSVMGTSGMNTPYQLYQPYAIYDITCAQMYGIIVLGGYVGSLLSAAISMLIAAKVRSISVAVCAPFLLFVVSPFVGRALSQFHTFFSLTPDQLTNLMNCARIPYIYEFGGKVFSQIPFIFFLYAAVIMLLTLSTYLIYRRTSLQ